MKGGSAVAPPFRPGLQTWYRSNYFGQMAGAVPTTTPGFWAGAVPTILAQCFLAG